MRKLFVIFVLALASVGVTAQITPVGGTLVASDNFTRADASTLGGNYTVNEGAWSISSNRAVLFTSPGNANPVYWSANTLSGDQYGVAKSATYQTSRKTGPAIRVQPGAKSGYYVYCSSAGSNCTALVLAKVVGGTVTILQTVSSLVMVPGTAYGLSAAADVLSVWVGGTQVGTNTSDSTFASGYGGLMGYGSFTSTYGFSYFEVGNIGAGVSPPTVSIGSGPYFLPQPVTITCVTQPTTIYYTTDGSIPTHGSSVYSAPLTFGSGAQTLKAICATATNDSSLRSYDYTFAGADVPLASDNFSAYYDSRIATDMALQNPLDAPWTSGAWSVGAPISGVVDSPGTSPLRTDYLTTQSTADCTAAISGVCISANNITGVNQSVYTAKSLSADHFNSAYVSGAKAYVCVRSSTSGPTNGYCVATTQSTGTVEFGKYVSGTWQSTQVVTGLTIVAPALVELRAYGSLFQVLLNNALVPGFPSSFTDATFASGVPALQSRGGYISNFATGGVGNSTVSTNTYSPTYPVYSDPAGSGWTESWPWLHSVIGPYWAQRFQSDPATSPATGFGIGLVPINTNTDGEMKYMGSFQDSQWIQATRLLDAAQPGVYWEGLFLKMQTWVPGLADGACAANGNSAQCADPVGYLLGTEVNRGSGQLCPATRKETCGVPFMYALKYSQQSTPWDNEYDFPATPYSPRANDQTYFQFYNSRLRAYCKAGAVTARWQPSTPYALNAYFLDSNGSYQVVDTAGTSGASEPITYGTSFVYASAQGVQTTSGTVVSEFFGAPCPPAPSNNGWSLIFDTPETDLLGQGGQPGLGLHMGPNTAATGMAGFTNITMGSGHNAAIDTVGAIEQPKTWMVQNHVRNYFRQANFNVQ